MVRLFAPQIKDGYFSNRPMIANTTTKMNIKDNTLLACDSKSCKVLKFTLDGRFVGGTSWLNFMRPQYIAVLNDGQIICTTEGMRVFFF